jgi:hypothetical protein
MRTNIYVSDTGISFEFSSRYGCMYLVVRRYVPDDGLVSVRRWSAHQYNKNTVIFSGMSVLIYGLLDVMILLGKSELWNLFCAVVLSLTLLVSCGFDLVRLFVSNLIFCTVLLLCFPLSSNCALLLLPLSSNCAVSVYLCNVAFSSVHLATGPKLLSLRVNEFNWEEPYPTINIFKTKWSLLKFFSTVIILLVLF